MCRANFSAGLRNTPSARDEGTSAQGLGCSTLILSYTTGIVGRTGGGTRPTVLIGTDDRDISRLSAAAKLYSCHFFQSLMKSWSSISGNGTPGVHFWRASLTRK
jgi:hypothetical protein